MWRRFVLSASIQIVVACFAADAAIAQKDNSCDRELRNSSKVVLKTPNGETTGKVCLDDGDSFGIENAWVRIRGIDAPEIGRNCLKSFDALPARCETSRGAIQALLVLSELLEAGAVCESERKGHINRWPVDCSVQGNRSLGIEMIRGGFACATNSAPTDYKAADLDARKRKAGLWADEWSEQRKGFPSDRCGYTSKRHASHLRYMQRKSRRENDGSAAQ